jgi:hypothetical protein
MESRRFYPLYLILFMALLLGLPACSNDDSSSPPADSTAPFVLDIDYDGQIDVPVDADIEIGFSEPMDRSTADGAISLSSKEITGFIWDDDMTLHVEHTDWAEGIQVTLTVGTGLKDKAGNALPQAWTSTFWTHTTQALLVASIPEDGEDGVSLNVQPMLRFTREMDLASLTSATTLRVVGGATVPIREIHDLDENWYRVEPTADLTELTDYNLTVTTDALVAGSMDDYLDEEVSIDFTTGEEADVTPPMLVSTVPASGTVIQPGQQTIVMNFSEPIDESETNVSSVAAQLVALIPGEPTWNPVGDQLTIYLRTPLPAGVRLFARFLPGSIRDLAGNGNATTDSVSLTVAGTADYIPIEPDWTWYYDRYGEETLTAKETYEDRVRVTIENRAGNRFDYVVSRSPYQVTQWTEDDRQYREKLAGGLYFLGLADDPDDITFDPKVLYQKLPFSVTTWSGSATMTMGTETGTLDYEGSVVGQETFVWDGMQPGDPDVVWEGCWKSILFHELSASGETFEVGTDTLWYAPGVGVIQQFAGNTEQTDEGTRESWSRMRLHELDFGD